MRGQRLSTRPDNTAQACSAEQTARRPDRHLPLLSRCGRRAIGQLCRLQASRLRPPVPPACFCCLDHTNRMTHRWTPWTGCWERLESRAGPCQRAAQQQPWVSPVRHQAPRRQAAALQLHWLPFCQLRAVVYRPPGISGVQHCLPGCVLQARCLELSGACLTNPMCQSQHRAAATSAPLYSGFGVAPCDPIELIVLDKRTS